MRIGVCGGLTAVLLAAGSLSVFAQDRETKVRNDRKLLEANEHWIYNDLPKALREAQRQKRPVLLVFRCIPCEACHEFDEQVVEREPQIRAVLDKFVCVRIPQANGLDLSQFQFDYDMSFAVMYLHHDGTLLGRFGTRTGRENEKDDMHLLGFAESMTRALELSANIEQHRSALAGKLGQPSAIKAPEEYPMLKGKYTDKLNYDGKVVQSCIHCHQVREAQRMLARSEKTAMPDALVFPWPGPSIVGLKMNPQTATTVEQVAAGSIAATAQLQPGDRLTSFNGQPLVSVADMQWVWQQMGDGGTIAVEAVRAGKPMKATMTLPAGWRQRNDISWRATTWDLRRMVFGGIYLLPLTDDERQQAGLPADKLGLRAQHVGEYGDHARAKQAGIRKNDIIVGYDGRTAAATESDLIAYGLQHKRPGDTVSIDVLREGKRMSMNIVLQ